MYINPFLGGVIATVGFECLIMIIIAVVSSLIDKHKKNKR